ncbi:hypothetical protein J6590_000826 [Homalodisca vitripennis]|nr:hypothetical protein J6590_000826 [Homalodisca vitripennis]
MAAPGYMSRCPDTSDPRFLLYTVQIISTKTPFYNDTERRYLRDLKDAGETAATGEHMFTLGIFKQCPGVRQRRGSTLNMRFSTPFTLRGLYGLPTDRVKEIKEAGRVVIRVVW